MKDLVGIDDFAKLDMRVGKIESVEIPEGSETLMQFTVDFVEEGKRTIFAGIKKWYEQDELVGRKTVFVLNLEPKKTPFGDSEGMLLAVDGKERPELLGVIEDVQVGSKLR